MRRPLLAMALALTVVGSGLLPPPTEATIGTPSAWATWVVNHVAKTITVTVKMQIYLGPCAQQHPGQDGAEGGPGGEAGGAAADQLAGRVCATPIADIAKAIKANIDRVWNKGLRYRCYRLIFVVDITFTDDRFGVDGNRVGARIDRSMQNTRSHVSGNGPSDDRWQSNEPADRWGPDNGVYDPTEFGFPPLNTNTYAHEFGHILGLDDQYIEGQWIPKPGAPEDIMSDSGIDFVDQTTVDRVVERNRDRLVDGQNKPVKLDDLRCAAFRATLEITQDEYGASNIYNTTATRPCTAGPHKSSTKQAIDATSREVDLYVQEDPSIQPLGYLLVPQQDTLTIRTGLRFGVRAGDAAGLFDMPIDVKVTRTHQTPASGPVPDPINVAAGCTGGSPGQNGPIDCGVRYYKAWMAMSQEGTKLWPISSKLPSLLGLTGFSMERLSKLYVSCPGPTPWPTDFAIQPESVRVLGPLPTLDKLHQVSDDWRLKGRDGRIEIEGTATLDINELGRLVQDDLTWTLTLCPVNKDGAVPTNCP